MRIKKIIGYILIIFSVLIIISNYFKFVLIKVNEVDISLSKILASIVKQLNTSYKFGYQFGTIIGIVFFKIIFIIGYNLIRKTNKSDNFELKRSKINQFDFFKSLFFRPKHLFEKYLKSEFPFLKTILFLFFLTNFQVELIKPYFYAIEKNEMRLLLNNIISYSIDFSIIQSFKEFCIFFIIFWLLSFICGATNLSKKSITKLVLYSISALDILIKILFFAIYIFSFWGIYGTLFFKLIFVMLPYSLALYRLYYLYNGFTILLEVNKKRIKIIFFVILIIPLIILIFIFIYGPIKGINDYKIFLKYAIGRTFEYIL